MAPKEVPRERLFKYSRDGAERSRLMRCTASSVQVKAFQYSVQYVDVDKIGQEGKNSPFECNLKFTNVYCCQVRRLGIPKMEEVGVSYSKSERGGGGDNGKKGMDILKDSQVRAFT